MTIPLAAGAAQALDVLVLIDRELAEAAARLGDAAAHAVAMSERTDWRTDAARRYHRQADDWSRRVAALPAELDEARSQLAAVRSGLQLRAWGWDG